MRDEKEIIHLRDELVYFTGKAGFDFLYHIIFIDALEYVLGNKLPETINHDVCSHCTVDCICDRQFGSEVCDRMEYAYQYGDDILCRNGEYPGEWQFKNFLKEKLDKDKVDENTSIC